MPRPRIRPVVVGLPKNVFRVRKPNGTIYYYHQTDRWRPKAERGPITPIPFAPDDARFWGEAKRLNNSIGAAGPDTFKALVDLFRGTKNPVEITPSAKWLGLAQGTRRTYGTYLDIVETSWRELKVDDLTQAGLLRVREHIADRDAPASANMFVTVLRLLLQFGITKNKASAHILAMAREITPIKVERQHSLPWPEKVWRHIVDKGPQDLSRLAVLGRSTGQRVSDIVRMHPDHLPDDLMDVKIKKRRGAQHFVPLDERDLKLIRSWGVPQDQPFITKPDGSPYTPDALRHRLVGWVAEQSPEWMRGEKILPHGLRAMAACDARLAGLTHDDIAALYGMSVQMVKTYTAHIDKVREARNARDKMVAENKKAKPANSTP